MRQLRRSVSLIQPDRRRLPVALLACGLLAGCGEDGVYEVSVEVGGESILVKARAAEEACCELGYPSAPDGCDFISDVPDCEPCGCVQSIAVLTNGSEIARSDPYVRRVRAARGQHEAYAGDTLEVVVHGCHGAMRFDVIVPEARPSTQFVVETGEESVAFEWTAPDRATRACGMIHDLTMSWCCAPDTGHLTVPTSAGPYSNFSLGRLWASPAISEGGVIHAWEVQWVMQAPEQRK